MSSAPACPFCDGVDVERIGQWGGQMITSQWRCRECGSYFEAVRDSFDDRSGSGSRPSSIDRK
jgi:ribosomal protein L37AE/L43A